MSNASEPSLSLINNSFYDDLGERWYDDDQHAIALLRAESRLKLDYVRTALARYHIDGAAKVLDVACGAGFVSIPLAEDGFAVTGIDLSAGSIATAARRSRHLPHLQFACEDAFHLSAADGSYDAILMLDFLEHVEDPRRAIREALRVLRPGGVIVVHTFNRTLAARLLAIHALELLSYDCPKHVHVYELFLKPTDVAQMLAEGGANFTDVRGLRPRIWSTAFWRTVLTRRLDPDFRFVYSRSLAVGYIGHGVKA